MNCNEFQALDLREKIQVVGTISHLLQNDSETFKVVQSLIRQAEQSGKLDGIEILPETPKAEY